MVLDQAGGSLEPRSKSFLRAFGTGNSRQSTCLRKVPCRSSRHKESVLFWSGGAHSSRFGHSEQCPLRPVVCSGGTLLHHGPRGSRRQAKRTLGSRDW